MKVFKSFEEMAWHPIVSAYVVPAAQVDPWPHDRPEWYIIASEVLPVQMELIPACEVPQGRTLTAGEDIAYFIVDEGVMRRVTLVQQNLLNPDSYVIHAYKDWHGYDYTVIKATIC